MFINYYKCTMYFLKLIETQEYLTVHSTTYVQITFEEYLMVIVL